MFEENPIESTPKFTIVDSVDDWVERWICITKPGEEAKHWTRYTIAAKGFYNVDAKEGHPTKEESAHDNSERYGGLMGGQVTACVSSAAKATSAAWSLIGGGAG